MVFLRPEYVYSMSINTVIGIKNKRKGNGCYSGTKGGLKKLFLWAFLIVPGSKST